LAIPRFDATNHGYHFFEEGDIRIRLLLNHWNFFDAETKAFIARKILIDHDALGYFNNLEFYSAGHP